jgi:hypothetical protein
MDTCTAEGCTAPATVHLRLVTPAGKTPLGPAGRRANAWRQGTPYDAYLCPKHIAEAREAGAVVSYTAVGTDVATRTVADG